MSPTEFACERTLSVASHDAFWPPYVLGINGELQGAEVDALNIIFAGSPFCFKVELLPNSKRAFVELKHGRIDLGWAASYTDNCAKHVHFSESYRTEVMRLYENKNNLHNVDSLEDIFKLGLTVGANFGSYYGEEFEQYKTKRRSKFAYFSQSYRDEVMLLYKNTLSPNLSSIEQLFSQGFSIAVNRGSYYGEQFELLKKAYPKQVVLISTADKRFEMLNKQRVDFVIEDALSGLFFLKQSLNI